MFEDIDRQTVSGPQVQLDCPQCGVTGGLASSQEEKETFRVIGIRLYTHRNTYITCLTCQTKFITRLRLSELESINDLASHITKNISLVAKTLALVSLLIFCLPVLGLVLALIAFLIAPKTPNWVRSLAKFSMVISVIANLIWVFTDLNKLL